MLGKLIKYDFLATGRMVLPAYLGVLLFAVINRLFLQFSTLRNLWDGRILDILFLIYSLAIFTVIVLTAIIVIRRFYTNLLKDEGYLSHTLPVSIDSHIWAKLIPAACWIIASIVVVYLGSLIILAADVSLAEGIREAGESFPGLNLPEVLMVFELIIVLVLGLFGMILSCYSAMAVGQLFNRHKILGAVVAYMGMSMIFSMVFGAMMVAFADYAFSNQEQFFTLAYGSYGYYGSGVSTGFLQGFLGIAGLCTLLMAAVHYVITRYLLKNRLNLE